MLSSATLPTAAPRPPARPVELRRADELDRSRPGLPSGHTRLDAELPGSGWVLGGLNEILVEQPGALEWRLLTPMLQHRRQPLLLINPPYTPHLPGLAPHLPGLAPHLPGLAPPSLLWITPETPQQVLWACEQVIRAGDGGAVLAWLPALRDARSEQIRRLQAHALASRVPIFLFRPQAAAGQSSAAPLRLLLRAREPWQIEVHLLKRRGPAHEGWLALEATPPQLAPLLTPRMRAARLPAQPLYPLPNHALARLAAAAHVEHS